MYSGSHLDSMVSRKLVVAAQTLESESKGRTLSDSIQPLNFVHGHKYQTSSSQIMTNKPKYAAVPSYTIRLIANSEDNPCTREALMSTNMRKDACCSQKRSHLSLLSLPLSNLGRESSFDCCYTPPTSTGVAGNEIQPVLSLVELRIWRTARLAGNILD